MRALLIRLQKRSGGEPEEHTDAMCSGPNLVQLLERWALSGGVWQVIGPGIGGAVSVGLFRCDGGEEVDRISSADPDWLGFLAEHPCSEQS